jgi:hypothetical protein
MVDGKSLLASMRGSANAARNICGRNAMDSNLMREVPGVAEFK